MSIEVINKISSILTYLNTAINNNQSLIPFNVNIAPTKGPHGRCEGLLYRDRQVERTVKDWIEERTSFSTLINRYKKYDPTSVTITWPKHLPVRLFNMKGILTEGRNIFLVFPLALGFSHEQFDCFGFELIDVWENVFTQIILPCTQRVFTNATLHDIDALLQPSIAKISYLAAVFHEIGHKIGCWKIFPTLDKRIDLPPFCINAICELETDMMLCLFLSEFPELRYFILLQRIFWFGRLDFSTQQQNGAINNDHDAWIGSFLWAKSVACGLIKEINGKIHICLANGNKTFQTILNELAKLKKAIVEARQQAGIVHTWMQSAFSPKANEFVIPDTLRNIFLTCIDIPNYPKLEETLCVAV